MKKPSPKFAFAGRISLADVENTGRKTGGAKTGGLEALVKVW